MNTKNYEYEHFEMHSRTRVGDLFYYFYKNNLLRN